MTTEELLMKELKNQWSRKGGTEKYIYLTDIDFPYLNKKIQKKIQEFEEILTYEDISFESYLKAIRECLILCKLLESLKMSRQTARICPLDREEYETYNELLLYSE